jgi:hypothetical protein
MDSELRFSKKAIQWRRSEILRLLSMGHSQASAARELKLDESVVSLDCKWLRQQSKEAIRKFLDEQLPEQVQRAFISYDQILLEAWAVANSSVADKRTKLQALALAKDTLAAKLDLASNVDVVSHVLDLAQKKEKDKHLSSELKQTTTTTTAAAETAAEVYSNEETLSDEEQEHQKQGQ